MKIEPPGTFACAVAERALRELTEAAEAVVESGFVASPDLWQRLRVAAEAARAVLDPPACQVFEDDLRGLER